MSIARLNRLTENLHSNGISISQLEQGGNLPVLINRTDPNKSLTDFLNRNDQLIREILVITGGVLF